jgi:hypothetical protein
MVFRCLWCAQFQSCSCTLFHPTAGFSFVVYLQGTTQLRKRFIFHTCSLHHSASLPSSLSSAVHFSVLSSSLYISVWCLPIHESRQLLALIEEKSLLLLPNRETTLQVAVEKNSRDIERVLISINKVDGNGECGG